MKAIIVGNKKLDNGKGRVDIMEGVKNNELKLPCDKCHKLFAQLYLVRRKGELLELCAKCAKEAK